MAFGEKTERFESLPSTMQVAEERARAGVEEGHLIIAQEQSAGEGRLGRKWHSPRGGLWASLVLRPQLPPDKLGLVGLCFASCMVQVINEHTGVRCGFKWPNDVVCHNRKLAGILLKSQVAQGRAEYLIVGLGMNVNLPEEAFHGELRESATSLLIETGELHNCRELLAKLLAACESGYRCLQTEGADKLLHCCRQLDITRGRRVRGRHKDEKVEGVAAGIDDLGALLVLTTHGYRPINSAEVEWL